MYMYVYIYKTLYIYSALPTCIYVYHVHALCPQGQKMLLNPLELKLQMIISHHGVLPTKLQSS